MIEKEPQDKEFTFTCTLRQLSLATTIILAICFFIFIGGYFLGKKRAAQEFSYRIDQESLADQIYSSMCVLYENKDESEEMDQSPQESSSDSISEAPEAIVPKSEFQDVAGASTQESITGPRFRAVIAGFPASDVNAAKDLVARLTSNNCPAELIERFSRTGSKTIVWYQVVTKLYPTAQEVETIKPLIAKLAHVKEKSIKIDQLV